ncbi:ATP-binding protein [Rhodococcus sp. G-MC3]|uniref:ATP-binding protein n=1 Tax=Rhodococcus sp. G-MC3 TaxID=3046209 RepID=UPI0024B9639A|nr:ATP-binding protein [Rhodococcus sp. G-MC3]MDJ0393642.1 ATP-binding protein [Rhodococcus sp. G-MC3]
MENPYTPESGAVPRELVGRDGIRIAFSTLLEGLERGHARQSHLITGLRGVGKTVLLRELVKAARARRWAIIDIDAARRDDHGFRRQLAFEFRSALLAVSPRSKWKRKAVAASGVLGAFSSSLGTDNPLTAEWTELEKGTADTGALSVDLTSMILALGEAAQEHGTGVVLVIDELHRITVGQLGALIDSLHRAYLRELPITLVGAGLPRSDAIAAEVQVRAKRLFEFPVLDRLSETDAATLLRGPMEWDDDAVSSAVDIAGGIPAFLQTIGHVMWAPDAESSVTSAAVAKSRESYEASIDGSFFGKKLTRANELELAYLRAIADSPKEAETARLLGRTSHQCSETRSDLVEKEMIYLRPDGSAAFSAPGFDEYLRRAMPTLAVPAQKRRRRRYDP